MPRKTSSMEQRVRSAQNADKQHEWPVEAGTAKEADLAMYKKLQQQRSLDDWSASDLVSLASLSKLQCDAVAQLDLLREEGLIAFGGKSGFVPIQNPRQRVLHDLLSSVNSLSRRLGLTSMSVGEKKANANRAAQEREARSALEVDFDPRSGRNLM